MKRRSVQIAIGLAVLLIIIVFLIPLFINADTFRPMLENQLSASLGRKVTLDHLSFSLFSGSLVADNVTVADDPAFSATPFLQAKALHIGVETGPLIFHRQVRVTNFAADSPAINLIQTQNGTWNFSSLGRSAAKQDPGTASTIPNMTVSEVKINNGTATVSSLPPTGKPFVYTNVNLAIQQLSFAKAFPFQLSATLPANGSVNVSGTAGPIAQKDASETPMNATLQLKHFDPVASGVIEPSQGISMLADVNSKLTSDGKTLSSNGRIHADHLQLVRTGAPAPNPVDVDYAISYDLDARSGQVRDVAINTGSVAAHVIGSFRLTPQEVLVNLHLAAPNLPIDALEQLLPAFGVRLPNGSALKGGTLTANLAISGPAKATDIAGPVEISNTRLSGFDIGSRIQGLRPTGSSGGGTEIQTLRANVTSSAQSTQFSNIYGSLPQLGTATGNGTVSPAGALNFHLIAKLNSSTGVGAIAGGAMSAIGGVLGNSVHSAAANGIPLNITGTTSNPSIQADMNSIVKQQAGGLLGKQTGQQQPNPASIMQRILGKH